MLFRLLTRLMISFSVMGALYVTEFRHVLGSPSSTDLSVSDGTPSLSDALNEYKVIADKLQEVSEMLSH